MGNTTCWFCDRDITLPCKTEMVNVIKIQQFYITAQAKWMQVAKPVCEDCADNGIRVNKVHYEIEQINKFPWTK